MRPPPRGRGGVLRPRGQGEGLLRAPGEARRAPRGDARVTVGVSVKRKEDARLLVGAGRYLDDLTAPGLLHLAVVRSPHPHARVLAVDRRAARSEEHTSELQSQSNLV